ncbi:MAG: SAM-dependent DNA methyltransferase, partial [bacterium]
MLKAIATFVKKFGAATSETNATQHAARIAFDPHAEAIRGLVKQVDLIYKLAARLAGLGAALSEDDEVSAAYDRRVSGRLVKQLDE